MGSLEGIFLEVDIFEIRAKTCKGGKRVGVRKVAEFKFIY